MSPPDAAPGVLIASDVATDAKLVAKMLHAEFEKVVISIDVDQASRKSLMPGDGRLAASGATRVAFAWAAGPAHL